MSSFCNQDFKSRRKDFALKQMFTRNPYRLFNNMFINCLTYKHFSYLLKVWMLLDILVRFLGRRIGPSQGAAEHRKEKIYTYALRRIRTHDPSTWSVQDHTQLGARSHWEWLHITANLKAYALSPIQAVPYMWPGRMCVTYT